MGVLLQPEFWARFFGIVLIDLTLAGDNALVIALAVRTLPPRQRLWGRIYGTAAALVLRVFLISVATLLFKIPLLQTAGGVVLVWIAVKLVRQDAGGEARMRHGVSIWQAVWIILVADAVMSLDNVLAVAGAAHGDLVLVVFGIGLSLPIVVWGSGILARLMTRFAWIIWLGGGVLGYVAGEMIMATPALRPWLEQARGVAVLASLLLGLCIATLGWWFARAERDAPDDVQPRV